MKAMTRILCLALLVLTVGCAQVGTDEVGVKTVYLSITGDTGVQDKSYGTGYHIYVPPFTGFTILKKSEQKLEMTRREEKGNRPGRDELKLKATDGNDIWVDITLSWRVNPENAWMVVKQVGETTEEIEEQVVRPVSRGVLRHTLGTLSAEEFYDADLRQQQVRASMQLLNESLAPMGLSVTDVMVNDYRFADRYQKAIEDRKLYDQKKREYQSLAKAAAEDVERKKFDARAKSNRIIEAARGELEQAKLKGDAILYAAEQQAEAIREQKAAEAAALQILAEALAQPGGRNLVAQRLARALKGKGITAVPVTDGGTVSLVDVNRFMESLVAATAVRKVSDDKAAPAEAPAPAPEPVPEKKTKADETKSDGESSL